MKISMKDAVITPRTLLGPYWGPEEDEPFTQVAPKVNTSEDTMADEVEFDSEKVEALLTIVLDLKDIPELGSIREAARMQLHAINAELWEKLYPEQAAEAKKKAEEAQKAEEEKQAKAREQETQQRSTVERRI